MSVRIRAGRLNRRITLQSLTTADDAFGEPVETFATLANVWARVFTMGAKETLSADAERTQGSVIFQIRYRTDITERNRVVWGTDTYDIEGVQDAEGARKRLDIQAVVRG